MQQKVQDSKKTRKNTKTNSGLPADASSKMVLAALLETITAAGDGGCSLAQLVTATGCPKSRLYGLVHRLKQQGKIKNIGRGVYGRIS